MRYPTRAYQPDTTVVSNDRRRHHQASKNESRPELCVGAAFTYRLDKSASISGSQISMADGDASSCGFCRILIKVADEFFSSSWRILEPHSSAILPPEVGC